MTMEYRVFKQILPPEKVDFLNAYVARGLESDRFRNPDRLVPSSRAAYGDPLMERLLVALQPTWEEMLETELYPTYSYFRSYSTHDELPRHKDRPACEVTVSLCLGLNPAAPWPLYLERESEIHAVSLLPGDGVLYSGCVMAHWREPFPGVFCNQVFLHYVRRAGQFADWCYDKRPSLSFSNAS
jgi:hypothetical protein